MEVDKRRYSDLSLADGAALVNEALAVCQRTAPDRGPMAELSERLGRSRRTLEQMRAQTRRVDFLTRVALVKLIGGK